MERPIENIVCNFLFSSSGATSYFDNCHNNNVVPTYVVNTFELFHAKIQNVLIEFQIAYTKSFFTFSHRYTLCIISFKYS